MYLIKSKYGYVKDFDGEDYLWAADVKQAYRMLRIEVNLVYNRLAFTPGVEKVEVQ